MAGKNDNIPLWFRNWQQHFYKSSEWQNIRRKVIIRDKGISCVSGKKILPPDKMLVDHINKITPENYNDPNITLNMDNLQLMSLREHNALTFEADPDFSLNKRKKNNINLF